MADKDNMNDRLDMAQKKNICHHSMKSLVKITGK